MEVLKSKSRVLIVKPHRLKGIIVTTPIKFGIRKSDSLTIPQDGKNSGEITYEFRRHRLRTALGVHGFWRTSVAKADSDARELNNWVEKLFLEAPSKQNESIHIDDIKSLVKSFNAVRNAVGGDSIGDQIINIVQKIEELVRSSPKRCEVRSRFSENNLDYLILNFLKAAKSACDSNLIFKDTDTIQLLTKFINFLKVLTDKCIKHEKFKNTRVESVNTLISDYPNENGVIEKHLSNYTNDSAEKEYAARLEKPIKYLKDAEHSVLNIKLNQDFVRKNCANNKINLQSVVHGVESSDNAYAHEAYKNPPKTENNKYDDEGAAKAAVNKFLVAIPKSAKNLTDKLFDAPNDITANEIQLLMNMLGESRGDDDNLGTGEKQSVLQYLDTKLENISHSLKDSDEKFTKDILEVEKICEKIDEAVGGKIKLAVELYRKKQTDELNSINNYEALLIKFKHEIKDIISDKVSLIKESLFGNKGDELKGITKKSMLDLVSVAGTLHNIGCIKSEEANIITKCSYVLRLHEAYVEFGLDNEAATTGFRASQEKRFEELGTLSKNIISAINGTKYALDKTLNAFEQNQKIRSAYVRIFNGNIQDRETNDDGFLDNSAASAAAQYTKISDWRATEMVSVRDLLSKPMKLLDQIRVSMSHIIEATGDKNDPDQLDSLCEKQHHELVEALEMAKALKTELDQLSKKSSLTPYKCLIEYLNSSSKSVLSVLASSISEIDNITSSIKKFSTHTEQVEKSYRDNLHELNVSIHDPIDSVNVGLYMYNSKEGFNDRVSEFSRLVNEIKASTEMEVLEKHSVTAFESSKKSLDTFNGALDSISSVYNNIATKAYNMEVETASEKYHSTAKEALDELNLLVLAKVIKPDILSKLTDSLNSANNPDTFSATEMIRFYVLFQKTLQDLKDIPDVMEMFAGYATHIHACLAGKETRGLQSPNAEETKTLAEHVSEQSTHVLQFFKIMQERDSKCQILDKMREIFLVYKKMDVQAKERYREFFEIIFGKDVFEMLRSVRKDSSILEYAAIYFKAIAKQNAITEEISKDGYNPISTRTTKEHDDWIERKFQIAAGVSNMFNLALDRLKYSALICGMQESSNDAQAKHKVKWITGRYVTNSVKKEFNQDPEDKLFRISPKNFMRKTAERLYCKKRGENGYFTAQRMMEYILPNQNDNESLHLTMVENNGGSDRITYAPQYTGAHNDNNLSNSILKSSVYDSSRSQHRTDSILPFGRTMSFGLTNLLSDNHFGSMGNTIFKERFAEVKPSDMNLSNMPDDDSPTSRHDGVIFYDGTLVTDHADIGTLPPDLYYNKSTRTLYYVQAVGEYKEFKLPNSPLDECFSNEKFGFNAYELPKEVKDFLKVELHCVRGKDKNTFSNEVQQNAKLWLEVNDITDIMDDDLKVYVERSAQLALCNVHPEVNYNGEQYSIGRTKLVLRNQDMDHETVMDGIRLLGFSVIFKNAAEIDKENLDRLYEDIDPEIKNTLLSQVEDGDEPPPYFLCTSVSTNDDGNKFPHRIEQRDLRTHLYNSAIFGLSERDRKIISLQHLTKEQFVIGENGKFSHRYVPLNTISSLSIAEFELSLDRFYKDSEDGKSHPIENGLLRVARSQKIQELIGVSPAEAELLKYYASTSDHRFHMLGANVALIKIITVLGMGRVRENFLEGPIFLQLLMFSLLNHYVNPDGVVTLLRRVRDNQISVKEALAELRKNPATPKKDLTQPDTAIRKLNLNGKISETAEKISPESNSDKVVSDLSNSYILEDAELGSKSHAGSSILTKNDQSIDKVNSEAIAPPTVPNNGIAGDDYSNSSGAIAVYDAFDQIGSLNLIDKEERFTFARQFKDYSHNKAKEIINFSKNNDVDENVKEEIVKLNNIISKEMALPQTLEEMQCIHRCYNKIDDTIKNNYNDIMSQFAVLIYDIYGEFTNDYYIQKLNIRLVELKDEIGVSCNATERGLKRKTRDKYKELIAVLGKHDTKITSLSTLDLYTLYNLTDIFSISDILNTKDLGSDKQFDKAKATFNGGYKDPDPSHAEICIGLAKYGYMFDKQQDLSSGRKLITYKPIITSSDWNNFYLLHTLEHWEAVVQKDLVQGELDNLKQELHEIHVNSDETFKAKDKEITNLRSKMAEILMKNNDAKSQIKETLVSAVTLKNLTELTQGNWDNIMDPNNNTFRLADRAVIKCFSEVRTLEDYNGKITSLLENPQSLDEQEYSNLINLFVKTKGSHIDKLWFDLTCKLLKLNNRRVKYDQSHFFIENQSPSYIPDDGDCALHCIQYLLKIKAAT